MVAAKVIGFVAVLVFCGGCGPSKPTNQTPDSLPAEYRPYLRDGKVAPTGNATLDYWVHINVFLSTLKGPQNDLALPTVLQSMAKFVREKSVVGVDPDVARWGVGVAGVLEAKAGIQTQLNDPATMRLAREKAAAGNPEPLAALKQAVSDWERERDRVVAEGKALQETLSRRHALTFPPPQL